MINPINGNKTEADYYQQTPKVSRSHFPLRNVKIERHSEATISVMLDTTTAFQAVLWLLAVDTPPPGAERENPTLQRQLQAAWCPEPQSPPHWWLRAYSHNSRPIHRDFSYTVCYAQ